MCDEKLVDVEEEEQFGGGGGTGECHIEPTCGPVCLAYRSGSGTVPVTPPLLGPGDDAATATGQTFISDCFVFSTYVFGVHCTFLLACIKKVFNLGKKNTHLAPSPIYHS